MPANLFDSGEKGIGATPIKGVTTIEAPQRPKGNSEVGGAVADYTPRKEAWGRPETRLSNETVDTLKHTIKSHMEMIKKNQKSTSPTKDYGDDSKYLTWVHHNFLRTVGDLLGQPEPWKLTTEQVVDRSDQLLQSPKMQLVVKALMDYEQLGLQLVTGQKLEEPQNVISKAIRTIDYAIDRRRSPNKQGAMAGGAGFAYQRADMQEFHNRLFDRDGWRISENRESFLEKGATPLVIIDYDAITKSGTTDPDDQIKTFMHLRIDIMRSRKDVRINHKKVTAEVLVGADIDKLEDQLLSLIRARTEFYVATGIPTPDQLRKHINLISGKNKIARFTADMAHFQGEDANTGKSYINAINDNLTRLLPEAKTDLEERWKKEREEKAREARYAGARATADTIITSPDEGTKKYTDKEKNDQRTVISAAKIYEQAVKDDQAQEDVLKGIDEEISDVEKSMARWNMAYASRVASLGITGIDTLEKCFDASIDDSVLRRKEGLAKLKAKHQEEVATEEGKEFKRKTKEDTKIEKQKILIEQSKPQHESLLKQEQANTSNILLFEQELKGLNATIPLTKKAVSDLEIAYPGLIDAMKPPPTKLISKKWSDLQTKLQTDELRKTRLEGPTGEIEGLKADNTVRIKNEKTTLDYQGKLNQLSDLTRDNTLAKDKAEKTLSALKIKHIQDEDTYEETTTKLEALVQLTSDTNEKPGAELVTEHKTLKQRKDIVTQKRKDVREVHAASLGKIIIPGSSNSYELSNITTAKTTKELLEKISTEARQMKGVPLKTVTDLTAYIQQTLETDLQRMEDGKGTTYDKEHIKWRKNQALWAKEVVTEMGPASKTAASALAKRMDSADDPLKTDWYDNIWTNRYKVDIYPTGTELKVHVAPIFVKLYKILGGEDVFEPANKDALDKLMKAYTPDILLKALAADTTLAPIFGGKGYYDQDFFATTAIPNQGKDVANNLTKKQLRRMIDDYLQDTRIGQLDTLELTEHTENARLTNIKPDQVAITGIESGTGTHYDRFVTLYQTLFFSLNQADLARRIHVLTVARGTTCTDEEAVAYATKIYEEKTRQFSNP